MPSHPFNSFLSLYLFTYLETEPHSFLTYAVHRVGVAFNKTTLTAWLRTMRTECWATILLLGTMGFVHLSVIKMWRLPLGLHYLCSTDYPVIECSVRGREPGAHYPVELSVVMEMFCVFSTKRSSTSTCGCWAFEMELYGWDTGFLSLFHFHECE